MSPKIKVYIKKYGPWAILLVIVISVVIIITSLFQGRKADNNYYKELLAAKDETIRVLQVQRNHLTKMHADLLVYAKESDRRDSVLLTQILEHQKKYQSLNKSYAQIPDRINKLAANVDSLLAAYRDY